ncbi:hypothetical protein I317_06138 [Kwoniella heveanensis CBS 569]|nr:hypothetical protein I317_06138 [Kwoniella heveanensis CBS 569]
MVFQSHVNYLSAKLEVTFENNGVVDMLSGPNTGSSYSLPGHVIISVPSLPAPFEGRLREVRDLKVVMEGKSEFWDDHVTLATPSNPLLVPSHDPSRPQSARIKLAVAFDMRLPGWLPPSHSSEMTNVSYGVLASSTIGWTEMVSTLSAPSSSSSRLSSTDGDVSMDSIIPFRHNFKPKSKNSFESFFTNNSLLPKTTDRSTGKWTPFTILRHRLPTSIGGFAQERSERHYTLRPEADSTSPVECVVTVPDWVDVNGEEKSLKVSLRVRARKHAIKSQVDEESSLASSTTTTTGQSQPAAASNAPGTGTYGVMEDNHQELDAIPMERQTKGKKADDELLTHILELGMEVEEVERYSSTPTTSFTSSFPLPAEQPSRHSSHHQLISPRSSYADGGFLGYDERPFRGIRTRQCLLSEDGNQRNFFFADNGLGLGEKWRKVNVVLPMPADIGKGLSSRPQPEMDGPFLKIKHSLKIRVVCRNIDGGKEDTQVVILSTPIRFGTCPSTMPSSSTKAPSLPAYIQLFHENGDLRECDALPVYSKSEDGSDEISDRPPVQAPIPSEPAPSYNSLFSSSAPSSATSYGCSSRSPSPSGSSYLSERSLSSSSLGRRERSSSPLPSSDEEPMDVDGALSSDEETRIGRNAVPSQTARKVARTVPRIVRTAA